MIELEKIERIRYTKPAVFKALELKATNPNLTPEQIGKITKRDKTSVHKVLKRYGFDGKKVAIYKKFRTEILAGVGEKLAEACMDEKKIEKASLKDCAISLGIVSEKERLFAGLSTQNIGWADVVEKIDKDERMIQLKDKFSGQIIEGEFLEESGNISEEKFNAIKEGIEQENNI